MLKNDKPILDKGRRHYRIQKTYKGIGAIRVGTGTSDFKTYKNMLTALDELYSMHDKRFLLRNLQSGETTVERLYELWKTQQLHKVSTGSDLTKIDPDYREWLATEVYLAPRTLEGYSERIRAVIRDEPEAVVSDLPRLVAAYKKACVGKTAALTKARAFNLARAAIFAYLSKRFSDQQHTYADVKKVKPFPKKASKKREPTHLTPADVLKLMSSLSPKYQDVVWSVYTCGFRPPSEYLGSWTPNKDGFSLTIRGTKTEGSHRVCPMPYEPVRHHIHGRSFAQILQRASGGTVQPYDLRRSFSRLLVSDQIGIPLWRVAAYMGHSESSAEDAFGMTMAYQKGAVTPADLKIDRDKIRQHLDSERDKFNAPIVKKDGERPKPRSSKAAVSKKKESSKRKKARKRSK